MLLVQKLYVQIESKEILKGVDLKIRCGEIHALMGPNGAGKSTLALSLMGHPNYKFKIQNSIFKINGEDMFNLTPEERAKSGLFISFQQPVEVTGVSFLAFLRIAYKSLYPKNKVSLSQFKEELKNALKKVELDESFMHRSINEGFSGGEKKRAEIVQLLMLKPKFIILDEVDSGLDIDSLKIITKVIKEAVKNYKIGVILITHYQRIFKFLKPDFVHILIDGKIKKSNGISLVYKIEKEGYAAIG